MEKFNNARKYHKRVYGSTDEEPSNLKKRKVDENDFAPSEDDLVAMKTELQNSRPRENILIELMKNTFSCRKSLINDKKSVADIVCIYPALKLPAVVSSIVNIHVFVFSILYTA